MSRSANTERVEAVVDDPLDDPVDESSQEHGHAAWNHVKVQLIQAATQVLEGQSYGGDGGLLRWRR